MTGVSNFLREVGEAPPAPFAPASFQLAALRALERGDVLVSAPTGSGKTWIAEQEIARFLRRGDDSGGASPASRRIWYTAPLKALSNQKFRRFQALYGEEAVGLLTGERRVNPHAPVLVATTEILRNALYDVPGEQSPPDVVVLDEAHYLADPDRGTAWEEILLLAPPGVRLLLLSATIPNALQLAAWLESVRGRAPEVITLETRPVPLQFLLTDGAGRLLPPDARQVRTHRRHPQWLQASVDALRRHDLTPAILFFPSRRECDDAARVLGSHPAPGEEQRAGLLRDWIARVPQLAAHPLLPALRRAGVAPHHAGHLTAWRMCVEELLERGLVRLVCATTTLAAGLDVPARTVLLSTLYRHGPGGPEPLTATEFHQMTGRAGRRGRDRLGIAVIAAETPDEAREGLALSNAAPDPVTSAFSPSDSQVLNLLARSAEPEAEQMLSRSFAAFLRAPQIAAARARLEALPADPLIERPCGDRLATRSRFETLLHQLRRARRRKTPAAEEVARLGRAVVEMPCTGCPVVERCLATLPALAAVEGERKELTRDVERLEGQEVRQFRLRAAVLRDMGYLDAEGHLTAVGRLAVRIRHPRMLVLAESLRTGLFPPDPPALAALCGALGTERIAGPGGPYRRAAGSRPGALRAAAGLGGSAVADRGLEPVRRALGALRRTIASVNERLRSAGLPGDPIAEEFESTDGGPPPALRRAAVVGAWAAGGPWDRITAAHHVADGDLQRLVWQAAEILAQLEDLPSGPLSAAARAARGAVLRSPVI
jgi:superfamily II RNA helicase